MDRPRLKAVDVDLRAFMIAQEAWHPTWKGDRTSFLQLTKAEAQIELELVLYFKDLSTRFHKLVNWDVVQQKRAADVTVSLSDPEWDLENERLYGLLSGPMIVAAEAGAIIAATNLNMVPVLGKGNANLMKAIREHATDMINGLSSTTRDKIKEAILQGIQSGHTIQEITQSITSIIDDPDRAELIARTESVKAASIGQIETARDIGAQFKVWEDGQPGACDECLALNGLRVPIDENFKTEYGEYDMPGAHPRCRCGMSLDYANDAEAQAIADGTWDSETDYGD